MNAPAIAGNGAVGFQHAVAGHGDGQQIGRAGGAYLLRTDRIGGAERTLLEAVARGAAGSHALAYLDGRLDVTVTP